MPIPASLQRGVVLIYTLIILLILTIGAIALIRSTQTSLFSAGNLAFRRDLVNQGEQATATVIAVFKTGVLSSSASTQADNVAANYSSTMLASNTDGVPNVLLENDTPPTRPCPVPPTSMSTPPERISSCSALFRNTYFSPIAMLSKPAMVGP